MTFCFVCKKDVANDYTLFTLDKTSDGYFTIGVDNPSMHGLALIVCDNCKRQFIVDGIKRHLEKDDTLNKRRPFLENMKEQLRRMGE